GTLPFDVTELDVDFACGGSVKWLGGGPGAAYVYVRRDLIGRFRPRAAGWLGPAPPFAVPMAGPAFADGLLRVVGGGAGGRGARRWRGSPRSGSRAVGKSRCAKRRASWSCVTRPAIV